MSAKPKYHHGDLRSALIEAGEAILEEHGLPGFTLRRCARAAGVSHAAPQHHFGNATGLLTAIATRGFERLLSSLREHLDAAGADKLAQFSATSKAYTAFAKARPEHFRIMFRCDLLDMENERLGEAAAQTFVELTNVIRRQRGEPNLEALPDLQHTGSTELLSDILIGWCFVHGYAHLRLEQQLGLIPEAQQEQLRTVTASRLSTLISGDLS